MFEKEKYEKIIVVGESGGGLVKVIVNGLGLPVKVEIDNSLCTSKDRGLICDLLVEAMSDGLKKSDNEAAKVIKEHYEREINKAYDTLLNKYYSNMSGSVGSGNGIGGNNSSGGKMN